MRTRLKLNPGERGTKKLVEKYGDQLVCVRYRYDARSRKRLKTVELIVDETSWDPMNSALSRNQPVLVRVGFGEKRVRERVKQAGGRWDPEQRLWVLSYAAAVENDLADRIVEDQGPSAPPSIAGIQ